MPRCSDQALEIALRELSEHAASGRKRANWLSTYLVAQRMEAAGYPMSINGTDQGVHDLYVLAPDHPRGRSNPFVDLQSAYRWSQVQDSGRKTVWNNATRDHPQTPLFKEGHIQNGLLPNAIDVLLTNLGTEEPLPGRDALAVFLTREHDWPAEPSREELHNEAAALLGITPGDFRRISQDDPPLSSPILGTPEWSSELLKASLLGPPAPVTDEVHGSSAVEEIPIGAVHELPEQFRRFLGQYGIAVDGPVEIIDILASTLASQLLIMAGPSGSGKSLMASALAAFFAPADRRGHLESQRLLAKPEEFFGYYSHLVGAGAFVADDQLLSLLEVAASEETTPPIVTIEEANLSPIEGYLSPLVHGLGGLESSTLAIRLHGQPTQVESQIPEVKVPPVLELQPYPRFFATINVDAESPAPARKVVSRACVMLLETPRFETALAAADTLVHPSVGEANGPAASLIGRPTVAFDRYAETGSDAYQQALTERAARLRNALGVDAIAHRQLQRSLMYMAWFVELSGTEEPDEDDPVVQAAADNTLVHFILPSLPAAQFERALDVLDDGQRAGVLAGRLARLRGTVAEHQFGPPPDFWGALS